jgi:hypothetical protein
MGEVNTNCVHESGGAGRMGLRRPLAKSCAVDLSRSDLSAAQCEKRGFEFIPVRTACCEGENKRARADAHAGRGLE